MGKKEEKKKQIKIVKNIENFMAKIGKKKTFNCWKKQSLLSSIRETLTLQESLLIIKGIKSSSLKFVA